MLDHQHAEVLGIGQGAAEHIGVGDGLGAVGDGDGAGLLEAADLGHQLAAEALGDRRHGRHAHRSRVARPAHDEIDDRRVIDHRLGVGHDDHGGDAARRRRFRRAGQRLAVFGAGFAGEHPHVDEARHQRQPGAVDDGCAGAGSCRA